MNRLIGKVVLVGILALASWLATADQAGAWGYGCCGTPSYGWYAPVSYVSYSPVWSGGYASFYGPCCNDGWVLGWRHGPIRRLAFGSWKWYRVGGCCYSPCYDWCCGTTVTSCCDATVAPAMPTTGQPTPAKKAEEPTSAEVRKPEFEPSLPIEPSTPAIPGTETPGSVLPPIPGAAPSVLPDVTPPAGGTDPLIPSPPSPSTSYEPTPANSGMITVWVPYDAKVTVNGMTTKSTGSRRQFVSYGLKTGFSYKYDIHAEIVRDGQIVEENRTVVLTAGEDTAVAFGFNTAAAEAIASR